MKVSLRFSVFAFLSLAFLTAFPSINFTKVSAESNREISPAKREEAYHANNVGVARLEQFDYKAGVEAFRRALTLDPQLKIAQINLAIALFNQQDIEGALQAAQIAAQNSPEQPQPFYILGLIARTQNRAEDAVGFFKKVLAVDPNDVGANVNLGQIYASQRNYAEAQTVLRRALAAEPYNSTAVYNLATVLLRSDARDEGQRLMTRFQALRQSGAATTVGQNYLEQGRYAEAIASTGAESELVDKTEPKVSFNEIPAGVKNKSSIALPLPAFKPFRGKPQSKYQILRAFEGGETLIDFDGDGNLDLARIDNTLTNFQNASRNSSPKTSAKISLYRNVGGKFTDVSISSGDLAKPLNTIGMSIIAGDFDNDNLPDLLLVGYKEIRLYRNEGQGKFKDVSQAAKLPEYPFLSISSAFVDADHDGDLDIFIAGFIDIDDAKSEANDFAFPNEFPGVPNLLLQNNGDGTFTDVSDAAKINQTKGNDEKTALAGKSISVVPLDYDNRRDIDLLVLNHQGKPNLLRNLRDGSFKDVAGEVGLSTSNNWTSLAVGDFNKDGFVDFFFGNVAGWNSKSDGKGILAISDGNGKFNVKDAPKGTENATAAQFLDYDNDGLLDLLVSTAKGLLISRNLGNEFAEATAKPFKQSASFANENKILSADLDNDGDLDLLIGGRFLRNDGGSANNSEIFRLQGRVSNRTAVGAKVDMRAGSLTQKLESYSASPMPAPSEIHFGLGKREKPDTVRVIWTSGVVQAELEFPEKSKVATARNFQPLKIEELDRKPSSCPYLYTWNGEKFEFITDFLGGGEMGNRQGAGVYNFPDSDEFVRITSDQLKPKNGKYEIRVTNELEEVLFLDNLKLVAVEHDANEEVFPNEGLGIPTAGKQILYTTRNQHTPLSAVDTNGRDVTPKIKNLDRVFYDDFKSLNIRGYAAPHNLTLNLDDKKGFDGRTLLLLTGWTDYAFSSDNLAAAQSGKSQFLPKLQVKNKRGEWQTVIDSIGISIGRPQTVVVDLTGKFLSDSREVRIVTNFKTFWDKIVVDTSEQNSDLKIIELKPLQADLRARGFSAETRYGAMIAPDYEKVSSEARWKYFAGHFTKTGDVLPLLNQIDDVFVISKTGDELVLSFDALPEPAKNKKYTFLLYADGYSKEMDINSGSPDTVFPLPFKGMSKYPYAADERFPMTEEKRKIYDEYTTRTVKGVLPRVEMSLLK